MFFGYARVSTSEQVDGSSLESQRRAIQGLAMLRGTSGFNVQIFEDAGVSGSMPLGMRPSGHDLLQAVKAGDTVAAAKLDRMFRDALDAHKTYIDFKERGVDLILADMGAEPVTKDGMSKVFFIMLSAFAELERNRIRDRVIEGKRAKKAAGGHAGGRAPLGFKIVGSGRTARLEKDEGEQALLNFTKYYVGAPPGAVAKVLEAEGFVSRTGKPYGITQVKRVLAASGPNPYKTARMP